MHEVSGKCPSTGTVRMHPLRNQHVLVMTHRKKNRKWKLLQAYLPYLGWGLLSLVTLALAYREHKMSKVGLSLQTATQDLNVLKTQQSQLQVCFALMLCNVRN